MRCLRKILGEWIALNNRLGRQWRRFGDLPWWHIERALVSLLAGAIWKSGGDAFEEYSEDKRGSRIRTSGRIDLWFSYRKEEFKAEAKQCWLRSHRPIEAFRHAQRFIKKAKHDAGKLNPDGMRRLAIVFGAVMFPKSRRDERAVHIKSAVALAKNKKLRADAVAWVFPKLNHELVSSDNYVLPGIIIWIKEVQRSRKK